MSSNGIEGLVVETHNWGKSVAFWRDLGYELEEPALLRHRDGGPFIFLVEQPETRQLEVLPIVAIEDPTAFTPPAGGTVQRGFEPQHRACRKCCYWTPIAGRSAFRVRCPRVSSRLKATANS